MPTTIGSGTGVGGAAQAIIQGEWTSETLTNSVIALPGDFLGYWGILKWQESGGDGNSSVKVDILKSSDDSVLIADLVWDRNGHDLSIYPTVRSEDIKIKFKLQALAKTPVVKNISLRAKDAEQIAFLQ